MILYKCVLKIYLIAYKIFFLYIFVNIDNNYCNIKIDEKFY